MSGRSPGTAAFTPHQQWVLAEAEVRGPVNGMGGETVIVLDDDFLGTRRWITLLACSTLRILSAELSR